MSANKRQAKILKECVNQLQEICMIVPLVGQHLVTDFKKCGLYLKSKSSLPQLFRKLLDNCCLEPSWRAPENCQVLL